MKLNRRKAKAMQTPSILQGASLTRLLQGIAAGAIATLVAGFYFGGWVTGGTAKGMVQKSAETTVVSALAPICARPLRGDDCADEGARPKGDDRDYRAPLKAGATKAFNNKPA
jgi:hypothetical protein